MDPFQAIFVKLNIYDHFQIVLKGYGFENEPEGGLIIIDRIEYYGHVDTPDNCAPKNLDSNELEPLSAEAEEGEDEKEIHLVSADVNKGCLLSKIMKIVLSSSSSSDFYDERHLVSNEINTRKAPRFPTVIPPSKIDEILKHEGQNFNETEEEKGEVEDEIIDDFDMESQNITKRDSEMKVVCR